MKIVSLCLIPFLLINTISDIRKKQICIWSVPLFLVTGIGINIYTKANWGLVAAGAGLGFVVLCLAVLSKNAIGPGDGLVILICGLYLGLAKNLLLLMCGLIMTSICGVFLILIKRAGKKTQLPFVPFLFLSYMFIFVLLGEFKT